MILSYILSFLPLNDKKKNITLNTVLQLGQLYNLGMGLRVNVIIPFSSDATMYWIKQTQYLLSFLQHM